MANPMGGGLTREEQIYLMQNLPDITAEEERQARMAAEVSQLREGALPSRRMDWASQVGRGLTGVGAGVQQVQGDKSRAALGERLRRLYGGWPGMGGAGNNAIAQSGYGTDY